MYFEKHHSYTQRHGWTFTHKGETLAPMAASLHEVFQKLETEARQSTAKLLQDPTVHHESSQVIQGRNNIVKYGQLREKCAVWAYEFARQPYREYALGIGDIAFFDGDKEVEGECVSNRNNWKFHYCGEELISPITVKIDALLTEVNLLKGEQQIEMLEEIEMLRVLLKQLQDDPARAIVLALGDVVYFNLAG